MSSLKFNPVVGGVEVQVDGIKVAQYKPTGSGMEVPTATLAGEALSKAPTSWYAQATSNQTGITTEVDVTGLSITITAVAGQRVKLTGYCSATMSTVGTDTIVIKLKEGATVLQNAEGIQNSVLTALAVVAPSAGSHTYKLTVSRSGSGSATLYASATFPIFIIAEAI